MRSLVVFVAVIISASVFAGELHGQSDVEKAKLRLFCLDASPDGKHLAVIIKTDATDPDPRCRIGVLNLESKQLKYFKTTSKMVGAHRASWSPDSKSLVFSFMAAFPPGYFSEQMSNAETGRPVNLTSPFQIELATLGTQRTRKLSMGDTCHWNSVKFSPVDGKQLLAFDSASKNVALVDVDSGLYGFLLPATHWKKAGVYPRGFDWSPKRGVAYVSVGYSKPRTKEAGIWRVDLKSGGRKHLIKTPLVNALAVAPSDQRLAYATFERNAETGKSPWIIHVATLPDCKVRILSQRAADPIAVWSKTEDRLAFIEKGHIVIWIASTNKTVRIPIPEGQPESLSWIGSTNSLAYVINQQEIWVLGSDSGDRKRIVTIAEEVVNTKKATSSESHEAKQANLTLTDS